MNAMRWILPPGLFRLALAYVVFVNHTLPIHLGSLAVYVFFMLSGFWVYRMWEKEYEPTESPYKIFLVSRFWRLLPIYYLGLSAVVLTMYFFPSREFSLPVHLSWTELHFYFSYAFILGNAPLPDAYKIFLPTWSLDIEIQFYIVAPLIINILRGSPPAVVSRFVLHAIAGLGLVVLAIFYGGIRAQSAFLPMYLMFFLVGVQAAHTGWNPKPAVALGSAIATAAAIVICVALPGARPLIIEGSFTTWLSYYNPETCMVLALLVSPYAIATVHRKIDGQRAKERDRDFSNITYEVYLLHWSFVLLLAHIAGGASKYQQLPMIIGAWVAVFPLAWLVYRFIDQPIDKLRKNYVRSRLSDEATAQVVQV